MKDKFPIYLAASRLFSNSQKAMTFQNSRKFGEMKNGEVVYFPFEAVYLIDIGRTEIFKDNKKLTKESLINIFSKKDKEFLIKYIVFRELRKKGYAVKEGLKFGGEFRIYEKNVLKKFSQKKDSRHAKWICYPVRGQKIEIKDLIAKARISHSTGKKLLLAIVDAEEDVLFYEIDWKKM